MIELYFITQPKLILMHTHMNWHVEVIRLKGISHVSKCLEGVVPAGLLKSKSNSGFPTFLEKKEEMNKKRA